MLELGGWRKDGVMMMWRCWRLLTRAVQQMVGVVVGPACVEATGRRVTSAASLSHQASASLPANHVAQVLARSLKLTCALTHGVDEGEGFYSVLST
jgi:hypothetical protein